MTEPDRGQAPVSPRFSRLRAWATDVDWWDLGPLLAGIIAGWIWLIRYGSAFSTDGTMWGYGWPEYIQESWLAAQGDFKKIDDLRTAVYSGLVGNLGEFLGSYAQAGVLVSSLSAVAVVIAAGLGARALSTSWAGGVAAMASAVALTHQEVPTTINQYPLLAGVSSLALGMALTYARWPKRRWVVLSGLMAGLAWAVETRGLIIIPPVVLLMGLGTWRQRSQGWKTLLGMFLVTLAMGFVLREVLVQKQRQEWEHTAEYQTELVDRQRRVVHRWIGSSPALNQTPCAQLSQPELLSMDFLQGPCPRYLIQDNLKHQLPAYLSLGLGLTGFSVLLLLLPGRRGRQASIDSAILILGAGAGLLFVASLTPMPRRYLVQWAGLVAMIGAAGPSRLAETLGGLERKWIQPVVAFGLITWMLLGGIKGRAAPTIAPLGTHYARYVDAYHVVLEHLEEGDGLMDCSENYVELALLPRRTQPDHPTKDPRSDYCQAWINAPSSDSGQSWILVSTVLPNRPAQPRYGDMENVDLRAILTTTGTWQTVHQDPLWELWRRES